MARRQRRSRGQRKTPAPKEQRKLKQQKEVVAKTVPNIVKSNTKVVARKMCEHWQDPFHLEDGLVILASGWFDRPSFGEPPPERVDIGIYLDVYWTEDYIQISGSCTLPVPKRGHQDVRIQYPWRDGAAPDESLRTFASTCKWILHELKQGKRIDTGCAGGHGRTGTMLAALLITQGVESTEAIARVRSTHCVQAIETTQQVAYLYRLDKMLNGRTPPVAGTVSGSREWGVKSTPIGYTPGSWYSSPAYDGTPSGSRWSMDAYSSAASAYDRTDFEDDLGPSQHGLDQRSEYIRFLNRLAETEDLHDIMEYEYPGSSSMPPQWGDLDPDNDCLDGAGACVDRMNCGMAEECVRSALLDAQLGSEAH